MTTEDPTHQLDEDEKEILAELVHIGVGKACASLNRMISSHVSWEIPVISVNDMERYKLLKAAGEMVACSLNFDGKISGRVAIVFSRDSGYQLASLLNDLEVGEVDDQLMIETLSEVTNITVNSIMGSLSNIIHEKLDFQTPFFHTEEIESIFQSPKTGQIRNIIAVTTFCIEKLKVKGSFHLVFALDSLEALSEQLAPLKDS